MCYEMHQYTQKLSKTATNATVSPPRLCLTPLCWWCGTTPTTSITKLDSAKGAVTRAVILSQMQRKCVSLVSHLFYQMAALYFHTQLQWWQIFAPFHAFFPLSHEKGDSGRSARQQQDDHHQYFTPFQSQTSHLIACQSMLITREVTEACCCNKSWWYTVLFAGKASGRLCDLP